MKNFYSVDDIENVTDFVQQALNLKKEINYFGASPRGINTEKTFKINARIGELNPLVGLNTSRLGLGKTFVMLFFNPSLRTRLSSQKAAQELGMHVISMNSNESWKWEIASETVMNLDTAEHIKDAAKVISQYADIIGIRAFPGLKDREEDYQDKILLNFINHATVPVINLESSILHPCQSLADLMTINEHKNKLKNKIVVTWGPHPKALPQAVVNSFLEWAGHTDNEVIVTHPKGYELSEKFTGNCTIEYAQDKAFKNADFIYVKNWSSYQSYGKVLSQDPSWTVNEHKMSKTNNAKVMHCLPVRRNVVITDQVLDSPNSLIYQQANNRTHAAKMIIKSLLENEGK